MSTGLTHSVFSTPRCTGHVFVTLAFMLSACAGGEGRSIEPEGPGELMEIPPPPTTPAGSTSTMTSSEDPPEMMPEAPMEMGGVPAPEMTGPMAQPMDEPSDTPRQPCHEFEPDLCPSAQGCRTAMARTAFQDAQGEWAVDRSESAIAVACVDVRDACESPGGFYVPNGESGICYGLDGGCPPPDWLPCAPNPEPPSCETRPVELCDDDVRCAPYTAQPGILTTETGFSTSSEPRRAVSCGPANRVCDDELTYGAPLGYPDRCHEFPDSCLPSEWGPCEAIDLAEAALVACAARSPSLCLLAEGAMCQPINGLPGTYYEGGDFEPDLTQSTERVGCRERSQTCLQAVTYAQPRGVTTRCYRFSNGCIPTGWEACAPQPAEPEVPCERRDAAQCIGTGELRCTPIRARPGTWSADMMFTPAAGATQEAVGCREFSGICGFNTRHLAPPDDATRCYEFVTDCVPEDWIDCTPTP